MWLKLSPRVIGGYKLGSRPFKSEIHHALLLPPLMGDYCHLLFEITQCYNHLLQISILTNKGEIGGLGNIER
jgi:hypothetical protein